MDEKPKNKILKTYSTDIVQAVKKGETGLMQKIVHDKEGHEKEELNISPYSKKNRFFLFISLFLIILSLAIVFYSLFIGYNKSVPVTPQFSPIIFNDETNIINISNLKKEDTVAEILDKKNTSSVKIGGLEGLYFIKENQAVNFYDFASFFKFNLPENYKESINSNFLFGLTNVEIAKDLDIASVDDIVITPEPVLVEGETISLDSSLFFKTGTAEFVDKDAKNKAKESISAFLTDIDFATFKIKVTGTYSVERPSEQNDEIAENRRSVGLDILNEVLREKYSEEEIAKITIESGTKGVSIYDTYTKEEINTMPKTEIDKLIDSTQGIQYLAQAKTKSKFIQPIHIPEESSLVEDFNSQEVIVEEVFDPLRNPVAKPSRKDFFILMKVKSFTDVFPTMMFWEDRMIFDLKELFEINIVGERAYLLTADFVDSIIQNKNARVVYDKEGNIVLMYVYADDTSVILTKTQEAVQEVLLRLQKSKIRR